MEHHRGSGFSSPMYVYRWDVMRELIERFKDWDGDPYEAISIEYVDPLTGGPVFKTMTFFVQVLRPGERTRPVRQTASLLVAPFEGKGHSIIDGKRFDWDAFDNLAVPGGSWFEHVNGDPETAGDPVRRQRRARVEMLPPVQEVGSRRRRRHRQTRLIRPDVVVLTRSLGRDDPTHFRVFVPSQSNTTLVSHFDCPAAAKSGSTARRSIIAHMRWPAGTTIVDVADPRHPRKLATIDIPEGWHSHKVRVANGIMIVNHEKLGQSGAAEFGGGIGIYDVSRPSTPS